VREALLLDLGAIVFELHRQGRRDTELVHLKQIELRVVDDEVRGLADALEEGFGLPTLTASGLVARCTACERLMGSRDRFCPACGAEAGGNETAPRHTEVPEPLREPDFGDTIEVTALNAADHPAFDGPEADADEQDEPEDHHEQPDEPDREIAVAPAGAPAPWHRPPPNQALVPRAQRTLRAGRRMARQWLEQRRSDAP
jgi:hypothetical protein